MFNFGERSLKNLEGVHPNLVKVMKSAIADSPLDFAIIEGVRTKERQVQLYNEGKSKTLLGRHIEGMAVDLMVYVNGKGTWEFKQYQIVAEHIEKRAKELGIDITWGGRWRSIVDGPHFELNKKTYPESYIKGK